MKKGMKPFLQDTHALSEVVGFVLILGIILSVTSLYISQQVPTWTEDYEVRHADEVVNDFSELDSLVDGIVLVAKQEGETPAAASKSITMSPDRVPLFGMSPPGASIAFLPGDEEIFVIFPFVGNETIPPPENRSWEQNTTGGFNYTLLDDVVITASGVELDKQTATYQNLTINGTSEIGPSDPHYYNELKIINGGKLYVGDTGRLTIYANRIIIDSSSQIIGDQKGHKGGFEGQNGGGDGGGSSNTTVEGGGGGAGHGGRGGDGSTGFEGGIAYNDNTSFSIVLGSGGGGGNDNNFEGGRGGDGGGAIWLEAGEMNISGTITAKGGSGTATQKGQNGGGGVAAAVVFYSTGKASLFQGICQQQGVMGEVNQKVTVEGVRVGE